MDSVKTNEIEDKVFFTYRTGVLEEIDALNHSPSTKNEIQSQFDDLLRAVHDKEQTSRIKQLEKENQYMKKEREKWLELQNECQQIKSKLDSHISESDYLALKTDYNQVIQENSKLTQLVQDTELLSKLESLKKENSQLKNELKDTRSEFEQYKESKENVIQQLKSGYEVLNNAYNVLKERLSDELLRGFHDKNTDFHIFNNTRKLDEFVEKERDKLNSTTNQRPRKRNKSEIDGKENLNMTVEMNKRGRKSVRKHRVQEEKHNKTEQLSSTIVRKAKAIARKTPSRQTPCRRRN